MKSVMELRFHLYYWVFCSAYIGGAGLWDNFTNLSGWHLFNVNSRSSNWALKCSSRCRFIRRGGINSSKSRADGAHHGVF